MLSIKNKQFDKVLPASKKIMALNFPAEREPLLVDHVRLTSAALVEAGQLPLAHLVLDEALKVVRTNKSKVTFYKEKALVCTKEGRDDLAVKWLEQAVKLEESKE
jgi:Flp pilus assembly protein TadD